MAYLTDDEIVEYFRDMDPAFVITDLPSNARLFATQTIDVKSGRSWLAEGMKSVYVDGRGTEAIYLTDLPITTLCEVTIINTDTSEETLDFSRTSEDRVLEYDEETGKIGFINGVVQPIEVTGFPRNEAQYFEKRYFPVGTLNVRVTGIFGDPTGYTAIVKQLELLLLGRQLSMLDPSTYAGSDLVKERIGKYEYQLLGATASQAKRMSMDEYIDFVFTLLPNFTSANYESV
jgi:hypothetical protein